MKPLRLIRSTSQFPFYNLALEEWLLQNLDTSKSDFLFLYTNENAVVIGRNQHLFQEVNLPYCLKKNIHVCRRISGGGTVFHDLGNLNWAMISEFSIAKMNNYQWAAQSILDMLNNKWNISAYLNDRNAIEVDGLKISGQAQFTNRKNIISHGTLLVNSDLQFLQPAIESRIEENVKTKASPSVRSKTVNLVELNKDLVSPQLLMNEFEKEFKPYQLNNVANVNLAKYQSEEWVYNRSPKSLIIHEGLQLEIIKGKVNRVFNKKGHLIKDSLFHNQTYKEILLS